VNAVVACSRADVFASASANTFIVYQHGPHRPDGPLSVPLIRRMRIPVVVVSEDSRRLQRAFGVQDELLLTVPNGYDQGIFKYQGEAKRNSQRVVFAGLCVPYKGLDIAVEAFERLRASYPGAEFHVFGATYDWNTSADHIFRRRGWTLENGGIDWRRVEAEIPGLRYFGEVPPAAVADAFRQAGWLIMPSRVHETFGMVSIEAQACGCLPVLPAQGAFPETMRAGRTGFLYDGNSSDVLASTLGELWSRQAVTEEVRCSAAAWARETFSWDISAGRIDTIMRDAMPKRHLSRLERMMWRAVPAGLDWLRELRRRSRRGRPAYE
jgi:glycosyltransferase involved in cell wall biosynthesis